MPDRFSFENIALSVSGKPGLSRAKPNEETPFRILVLGDFSSRESRGLIEPLAGRRFAMVDIDNLDQVLARLKPTLSIPVGDGSSFSISFSSLDDFYPDRLFERVPFFQKLRETRAALRNPARAREAAAEISSWAGVPAAQPSTKKEPEKDEDTFARLLGVAPGQLPRKASAGAGGIQDLIRQIIAPHVVASPDPNVATMTVALDAAISGQMRAILHAPAFQALEAVWRGLDFLIRNLETDETLQVYVCDVSKAELAADLRGVDDLARAAIFKTLVEETVQTSGGVPWAVIAANYSFESNNEDAELLARVAKIAAAAGAPFFSGAGSSFIDAVAAGRHGTAEGWSSLRALPEARWLGLAAPRFLLRLPYGRETEPIESFDFEEMPEPPAPATYLWGNPAMVCAYLLGESFRAAGWELSPGDVTEVSGLPAHTFQVDGEQKMMPCAEMWLTDRHADALLQIGIMPLLSIRGRDAVRLVRFQSLAAPPTEPAGRWS